MPGSHLVSVPNSSSIRFLRPSALQPQARTAASLTNTSSVQNVFGVRKEEALELTATKGLSLDSFLMLQGDAIVLRLTDDDRHARHRPSVSQREPISVLHFTTLCHAVLVISFLIWITTALPIHHDDYGCQRRFALVPESSDEAVTTVDMRRRPCWGIGRPLRYVQPVAHRRRS